MSPLCASVLPSPPEVNRSPRDASPGSGGSDFRNHGLDGWTGDQNGASSSDHSRISTQRIPCAARPPDTIREQEKSPTRTALVQHHLPVAYLSHSWYWRPNCLARGSSPRRMWFDEVAPNTLTPQASATAQLSHFGRLSTDPMTALAAPLLS